MSRIRARLLDTGPVVVLAVIAAVGSFTHISDLAARHGQHGWQSWAVAVCIDLMCVMAARELQRDKRTGRHRGRLISWPALVLTGGIVLTLAANLATAHPSVWGWITAATPAVAFLAAVSMLERRAAHRPPEPATEDDTSTAETVELVASDVPALDAVPHPAEHGPSPALLTYARRLADDHQATHHRAITGEHLAARMHVSADLATHLLTQIRKEPVT
ncbi:DUF2637 domain-containing protein [Nonomuraea glycinis]|uniref:DUF2637 domain-containing protein n=1 Tax=Nonomuraea glycinis TaxID=2047744 RepID=A0A918E2R8_9ACTN|nr:DUF2637 domain-containing protein [Nonomuraea glycinis]MCA2181999.1 DUF2637 domain-containing protein [Nonomuraea glycinis]GGP02511.1 hypothetical protein GCM10012278_10040 [Nonomuraea glycinis]